MARLFGTDGIRGVVSELMRPQFALEIGLSIGTYLGNKGKVALATDTRTSNIVLKSAMLSGLLSSGIDVVDFGIVPTPTLQFGITKFDLDFGVVITASHNPPEFNGIKCIDSDGIELARESEEKIEHIYFQKSYKQVAWDNLGNVSTADIIEDYVNAVLSLVDTEAIRAANLKVVLDCANGAGCFTTPYLLEKLNCRVILLNSQPQGVPSHPSEPTAENLQELITTVKVAGVDLGIAHDGDADRAIFVDELGNYVPGEKTLALCARELVKENKGLVVTAVSSSSCLEDVVKAEGGEVEYTRVGSPIIARVMRNKNAVFGGEENGGLIFPKFQYCRDGAIGIAKILEILVKSGKKFSELIAKIPQYYLYKTKISCPEELKQKVLDEYIKSKAVVGLRSLTLDGVKIFFENGWVLVRPSGTEPIYRIFAESKDQNIAKELAESEKKALEGIIKLSL
ncbi:MAG: phosphoglucosamine mutase [Candidatus Thermoplasmatota archaeon]|nr:phosphoglucosamine mutase [Candidatus Thermoplasmatota archaeon]